MKPSVRASSVEGLRQELKDLRRSVMDLQRMGGGFGGSDLPGGTEPEPSGGGGVPTIFVAASDASDKSKALADYVCDGTADNVEIQAAIDAIEALNVGGRIQLSEGTFYLADRVALGLIGWGILLAGFGDGTALDVTGSTSADGIYLAGTGCAVMNLAIWGGYSSTATLLRGISQADGSMQRIQNVTVMGVRRGIVCGAPDDLIISNCLVLNPHEAGIEIGVNGNLRFMVTDNIVNLAQDSSGAGILISGAGGIVSNNVVHQSSGDGIRLTGSANLCTGNRVTNSTGYGVSITGTGDRVAGNLLLTNAAGAINDAGTSTALAYSGGASGDNFT